MPYRWKQEYFRRTGITLQHYQLAKYRSPYTMKGEISRKFIEKNSEYKFDFSIPQNCHHWRAFERYRTGIEIFLKVTGAIFDREYQDIILTFQLWPNCNH